MRLAQPAAALHVARLRPGGRVAAPAAAYLHLFVARGDVELAGTGTLSAGDAARLRDGGGESLVAGPLGAEVLAWQMAAALH